MLYASLSHNTTAWFGPRDSLFYTALGRIRTSRKGMRCRLIMEVSDIVRQSALDFIPNVIRMNAPLGVIVEPGGNAEPQVLLFLLNQASNELELRGYESK